MAKPKAKTVKKKPPAKKKVTKQAVKKAVQQRISKKAKAEWEAKSDQEQTEYLKEHPESKYKKLGVTKKAEEHEQSNDGNSGADTSNNENQSTETNSTEPNDAVERTDDAAKTDTQETAPDKAVETPPAKEEPLVPTPDPKEPVLKRIKTGLSSIFKIDPSRIMDEAKAGYQEGLKDALTKPETHEEIKKRLEDYLKEPPKKAKDGLDLKTLAIGAAAILAIGGLAVAAPGLAIVVGLQLAEKAPEIMGQLNERAQRKQQEAAENAGKEEEEKLQKHDMVSQQLADIIGETVNSHVESDDDIQNLVRKAVEDSNEEQSPEEPEPQDKPAEPPIAEDTKTGESDNQETKEPEPAPNGDGNSGTDTSDLGPNETVDNLDEELDDEFDDEDDDEDYEDDEEEEETPPPPKKRGRQVKAAVIKAFDAIDFGQTHLGKTIEKVVAEIKEKESTGTYAALKLHPSSARLLNKWALDKGIKNAFAPGDMHITVCYSRKPVDYKPLSFIHGAREVKPKDLGLLGREEDKKMLVLHLQDGGFPQRRFNYAKSIGASHDFPEYLPHISIAPPGHGYTDPSSVEQIDANSINFPLLVDYEYYNELNASDIMNDIPLEGYATPKPNPVRVVVADDEGRLVTSDGAHLDHKKGDMLLTDSNNNTWPVKPSIFKGKYVQQEDGTYDKKKINVAYKVHDEEKPLVIETLEGPVTANQGDVIMTGTEGEQWPIPRKRFDELYSVIVDDQVLAFLSLKR